jgi:penicillin-binding protein 1A
MPDPPTPITHSPSARGPRFVRLQETPPPPPPPRRTKPKLKKLRLALVLMGLIALALVSTVFGMLMAVARDLPSLENQAEFEAAENSILFADDCKDFPEKCTRIARLTGNLNRILVKEGEISPHIKNAVIAIEDRRFYSHEGVDYTGIARALWQDILRRSAAQGGSTITQQFVKNALAAQGNRSVFQKLRESALAYHLEREWSKEKILTQYLNTVYFGNGAYGVEAAVRTYFGEGDEPEELEGAEDQAGVVGFQDETVEEPEDPEHRESSRVTPAEAALLAGMIASPSLYDPIENPQQAGERRNLVLARMLEQDMITEGQYEEALRTPIPDEDEVDPPDADSDQPYFTSWMTEHLLDLYSPGVVFGGGLKVKTTIDPDLQQAAEDAISGRLAGVGPSASLVAIENKTGAVKAMVGGTDFDARPFNLATNGHRQPGSAFKPFILVRALADGIDPNSSWASMPKELPFKGEKGPELFKVENYEDSYLGTASLWSATTTSDNSVFAELGMKVKPKRVARMARRMGIRTELSTNPAMLLGGLEEGVTPLEMAYAYSTLANEGLKVSGTLAPGKIGPVAIREVEGPNGTKVNEEVETRVFPEKVGQMAKEMLSLVVTSGTGEAAQVGDEVIWGKTGTTENYGDAWFVGSNEQLTVAVWVGYADKLQPMEYEYAGSPVAGGTYPAVIFSDFMGAWLELRDARGLGPKEEDEGELAPTPETYSVPSGEEEAVPTEPVVPEEEAPVEEAPAPAEEAPAAPPEEPLPTPPPEEPAPVEPGPVPETPVPPEDTGGGATPDGGL